MKVGYTGQQDLRISWENLSACPFLCMEDFTGWTWLVRLSLCYLVNNQNQINLYSVSLHFMHLTLNEITACGT